MTPPRLDVDACQEKVGLLADLVADLDRHTGVSGDELRADRDRRHAVERTLTQLDDIAASLNSLLACSLARRAPTGYRDGLELLCQLDVLAPELVDRPGLRIAASVLDATRGRPWRCGAADCLDAVERVGVVTIAAPSDPVGFVERGPPALDVAPVSSHPHQGGTHQRPETCDAGPDDPRRPP